jgi:hypothetical protein
VLSDGRFGVFRFGFDTDNLTIHHNAYFGLGTIAIWYNPGLPAQATYNTLVSWQTATGKDANTISPADLMLDASLKPLAGSPVIDKGTNLTATTDYTGKTFSQRNDIGAYEYFIPVPPSGGEKAGPGDGTYRLLYTIAWNTAGVAPAFGDGFYALTYKIAQNTAGTPPQFGDGIYNLFYKIAGNTAGTKPQSGDRYYDLLYKIAGNTGSNKPRFGDGVYDLLYKISGNTAK